VTARFTGASVARVEDRRFVTGAGRFLDDVALAGLVHAVFVRSSVPHARLRGVDAAAARRAPGVVAVITGTDLADLVDPIDYPVAPGFVGPASYPALAVGTVRHLGDPIAVVLATSRPLAVDAAEHVEVDYEPLPAVGTAEQALRGERPPIWEGAGSNVLWTDHRAFGDPDGAFHRADRVVSARLRQHRVTNAPLETRGLVASFDPGRRELTCWAATQNPQLVRITLARLLHVPAHSVRVVNGDIGGSFGQKAWVRHEDVAVAAATKALGRPVKWVEDRSENLATAGHARDEYADVEVAVTDDGRILGLRVSLVLDQGAYPIATNVRTGTTAIIRTLLPSAYRIEHLDFSATIVASNKGPYTTYRGPWAAETWIRERTLDLVAHELGMDPVALRRRNLWTDDELPRQMVTGPTLSRLTVSASLDRLAGHPTYAGFRRRQAAARAEGRCLGIGVSAFLEPAPGPPDFLPSVGAFVAPSEPARARVELDGSVSVAVVQTPSGQGHETTIAQVAADELGVPPHQIRIVHGDTDAVPPELFGTAGSRSAQKTTGAVRGACRDLAGKVRRVAAHLLEASEGDIELDAGRVFVRGSPARGVTFGQVAMVAWNLPSTLPPGVGKGLECLFDYTNVDSGWSQAVHCCVVEVDPETGVVTIPEYLVFEDCGDLINPVIVDGQIRGGVAQGISTVLYERVHYDDDANLRTTTFLDYLVPSACEIPSVEIHHVETTEPSAVNTRGVGEGGAIAAPAAVSNAVEDALLPFGARVTDLFLPPEVVLGLLRSEATARPCAGAVR
jgi:aerobic carbon-monoxide dehydrogenase large subunit